MLAAAARTHVGRVRAENQDAFVCRPEHGLFTVIDGMGGQAAGEVAAAIAAEAFAGVPNQRKLPSEMLLSAAMRTARDRILADARANPGRSNMGAVATAIRFDDDGRAVGFAHVGDTRLYRVNRQGVTQLTTDHVGGAPDPGHKARVARDLGRSDLPEGWVESGRVRVEPRDLLVLCSDGLFDPVPPDELSHELTRAWAGQENVDSLATRLVALALARGGPDNVTVVVIRAGRFRRRTGMARLGIVSSAGVLAALVAAVIAVSFARRPPSLPIPPQVRRDLEVVNPRVLTLPDEARTVVAAGRTLTLRGVRISGPSWTVAVEDGGRLDLDLATITLEGALRVDLGTGAELSLADAHLTASTIRIDGPGSAVLVHSAVTTGNATTLFDPASTASVFATDCTVGTLDTPTRAAWSTGESSVPLGGAARALADRPVPAEPAAAP